MKNFSILIFAALVVLTGCEPKQTALSGQMFIVTQGAENVKLGDIQVLLIEKSQVADLLQKKQTAIETEITARKREIDDAEKKAELAQADYESFRSDNLTNSDFYLKTEAELNTVSNELADLNQKLRSTNPDSEEHKKYLKESEPKYPQQYQLQQDLENMQASHQTKLYELGDDSIRADSLVKNAKTRLENFPTGEDYLSDFSPVASQETRTDADGKFSFVYSHEKPLSIFASAQRALPNGIEKYYWLVDAPTNAETVQVFLSNNNLVEVDPDNYFELRPK